MKNCLALAAAFMCVGGVAYAAEPASMFAADMPYELSPPSYFDGLYAGVTFGMAGADHGNFWPTGGIDRYGVGGVLGWSTYIAPRVVAGAEVQLHLDSDFDGEYSTAALALGRLGFTTSDTFMVHLLGGGGVFGGLPAWAFGAGFEWGVHDNVSVRADILTLGEAGSNPARDGVTAWIIKGGPIWHFGGSGVTTASYAGAAPAPVTDFDGGYLGLGYGIHIDPTWHFFPDTGNGLHLTRGHLGGFAGWNYRLTDGALPVVVGGEVQADLLFDTSGDTTFDALALGRLGVVPMEGLMLYGAGGVGLLQDATTYALGGGVEYALWGDASLRLESLALGDATGNGGFVASKTTLGAVWHLQ